MKREMEENPDAYVIKGKTPDTESKAQKRDRIEKELKDLKELEHAIMHGWEGMNLDTVDQEGEIINVNPPGKPLFNELKKMDVKDYNDSSEDEPIVPLMDEIHPVPYKEDQKKKSGSLQKSRRVTKEYEDFAKA